MQNSECTVFLAVFLFYLSTIRDRLYPFLFFLPSLWSSVGESLECKNVWGLYELESGKVGELRSIKVKWKGRENNLSTSVVSKRIIIQEILWVQSEDWKIILFLGPSFFLTFCIWFCLWNKIRKLFIIFFGRQNIFRSEISWDTRYKSWNNHYQNTTCKLKFYLRKCK